MRWYAAHGFWGVKIYNSMNPDFVKPIADEAHRLGLHVSGHVPAFMSSERAIRDGYDEIHHINQLVLSFIIDPLKDDTRTPFRFTAIGERLRDARSAERAGAAHDCADEGTKDGARPDPGDVLAGAARAPGVRRRLPTGTGSITCRRRSSARAGARCST